MSQSKKRDYLDQISPNCNHFNSRISSKKPTYKNKSWYTKEVDRGQNCELEYKICKLRLWIFWVCWIYAVKEPCPKTKSNHYNNIPRNSFKVRKLIIAIVCNPSQTNNHKINKYNEQHHWNICVRIWEISLLNGVTSCHQNK